MTPFARAYVLQSEVDIIVDATRKDYENNPLLFRLTWDIPAGRTLDEILEDTAKDVRRGETWLNDTYQVCVTKCEQLPGSGWPPLLHLSIKRRDREPIHDWRDLQRIKTELVGAECEGVELYPAESRVVDTANQYHLWVFGAPGAKWPFGFGKGVKSSTTLGKSKQRPL